MYSIDTATANSTDCVSSGLPRGISFSLSFSWSANSAAYPLPSRAPFMSISRLIEYVGPFPPSARDSDTHQNIGITTTNTSWYTRFCCCIICSDAASSSISTPSRSPALPYAFS